MPFNLHIVMLNASLLHILNNRANKLGQILRTVSVSRAKPIVFALANMTLKTAVGTNIRMPSMGAGPTSMPVSSLLLKPKGRSFLLFLMQPLDQLFLVKIRPAALYWHP